MVFVNRYSKNDAVNIFDSKKFLTNTESFTLAVGQTEGKGLISKIQDNGDPVWEKIYSLSQESLVIEIIEELTPKSSGEIYQYIAFTRGDHSNYIFSIKPSDGNVLWQY